MPNERKYHVGPPENLKLCEMCRWPFFPANMRRIYCSPLCSAKAHHIAFVVRHSDLNRGTSRPRKAQS